MNDKYVALLDEEPKHRKKSTAKGQPRANHKHQYEDVLLHRLYHWSFNNYEQTEQITPTEVCVICGRIGKIKWRDETYYDKKEVPNCPVGVYDYKLNETALSLPRWCARGFDKFAKPMKEEE